MKEIGIPSKHKLIEGRIRLSQVMSGFPYFRLASHSPLICAGTAIASPPNNWLITSVGSKLKLGSVLAQAFGQKSSARLAMPSKKLGSARHILQKKLGSARLAL